MPEILNDDGNIVFVPDDPFIPAPPPLPPDPAPCSDQPDNPAEYPDQDD